MSLRAEAAALYEAMVDPKPLHFPKHGSPLPARWQDILPDKRAEFVRLARAFRSRETPS